MSSCHCQIQEKPRSSSDLRKERDLMRAMQEVSVPSRRPELVRARKRILHAGRFGRRSSSGLLNPGVLSNGNGFHMLCRGEPDERTWLGHWFDTKAVPFWCEIDESLELRNYFALEVEASGRRRPEDWRLFGFRGRIFTNYTQYAIEREQLVCRMGIGEVDLDRRRITNCRVLEAPFEPARFEKNWAFFEADGRMLCVYSFRPFILLEVDPETGETAPFRQAPGCSFRWYEKGDRVISCSTNPVRWDDDGLVLFLHDFLEPDGFGIRNRSYLQYAVLLDADKLTPRSVVPEPVLYGGAESGRHPGVHYTMSLVQRGGALYAFFGEADSHTGVVVLDRECLAAEFRRNEL